MYQNGKEYRFRSIRIKERGKKTMVGFSIFHQCVLWERFISVMFNRENLQLYVALSAVLATLGLGMLALYQNKQLSKVNERLLVIEEVKFKPIIEFRNPTIESYKSFNISEVIRESPLFTLVEDEISESDELHNYFKLCFVLKNSTENIAKGFKVNNVKINTNKGSVKNYALPATSDINILSKTEINWSIFFNIVPKEDVHIFLYFEYVDLFDHFEINEYQVYYNVTAAKVHTIKSI